MTRILIVAAATLFFSSSMASAQVTTQGLPDAANPAATPPAPDNARTGTADRPPAAAVPDPNAPGSATSGQAPAASEKMHPEMGGDRRPPGAAQK
jgi:hypothetical protein